MSITHNDLIFESAADDKHYLTSYKIEKNESSRILKIHIKGNKEAIKLSQLPSFKTNAQEDEWLLSMGVILLLEDEEGKLSIPLIERDILASSDPRHLTTPAGRLDMRLSDGCWAEFAEEFIWGNEECYFSLQNAPESFYHIQTDQIEKQGLELKEYQILPIMDTKNENTWTVIMEVDGEEVDRVEEVFVHEDEQTKTLEFRKVFQTQKPSNIDFMIDGDGFGREVFVMDLEDLKNHLEKNSNPPMMDGYLNHFKGKKLKTQLQLPQVFVTSTVRAFLKEF